MTLLRNPLVGGSWVGAKNVACGSSSFLRPGTFLSSISSCSGLRILARCQLRVWNLSSSPIEDERERNVDDPGASFLEIWERAKQGSAKDERDDWARRENEFRSMLQVPREERDKVQRMQVIDRAAAALAAVNALLTDYPTSIPEERLSPVSNSSAPGQNPTWIPTSVVEVRPQRLSPPSETAAEEASPSSSRSGFRGSPGPGFWSWVPPEPEPEDEVAQPLRAAAPDLNSLPRVLEKDKASSSLFIPFETDSREEIVKRDDLPNVFQNRAMPSLPPLQSLLELGKEKLAETELITEAQPSLRMPSVDRETASAVSQERGKGESLPSGVHPDGSRWWQETGVDYRENGVICSWTIIRGVSADEGTEWEEKFWDASDSFDYKELGAEKSGRDSSGRVWHEFWKEAMWQDVENGLQHMEKTANKWGKDASGGQWREKWFEHYDASGRTEKWADKWSQIDSDTPVEPGHAHTWRERWGESFDGQGGAMKYTDKWAERKEHGDSWTKWGDKWDEHFDQHGLGVKQGQTWWEGINGEKWNRTWGERHNGSGWVHKYGKSSSGEHWDTHAKEDTWYERRPHFGFRECFENSRELRQVNERRKRQL